MALWLATLLPQLHQLATSAWEQLSQRGSPSTDIVGALGFAALALQAPGWFVEWLLFERAGRAGAGSPNWPLNLVPLSLMLLVNAAVYLPATLRVVRRVQESSAANCAPLLKPAWRSFSVLFPMVSIALAIYFWRGGGSVGDSLGRDFAGLSIASLAIGAAATHSCFAVTKVLDGKRTGDY
jgi:lipid-A-disaccharide synthase-like uncharacterized protein